MSRHEAETAVGSVSGRFDRRSARRAIGLLAAVFLASVPAGTGAAPVRAPSISVSINSVSTSDCRAVSIDYRIEWQGLASDAPGLSIVELQTSPDAFTLASTNLDLGRKADHWKGKIKAEVVRESGFFDSQTYGPRAYQLIVRYNDDEVVAVSDVMAIPTCVPMSPLSGPSAGGTLVTVQGGGTFGGAPFTMTSMLAVGGVTNIAPQAVASDGTWLTFLTPAGPAGTCVPVLLDGLPFSLPSFCYGS